jgi:hypothetical protein
MIDASIASVTNLLSSSGMICNFLKTNTGRGIALLGSLGILGVGSYFTYQGIRESINSGNYAQAWFRGSMMLVDLIVMGSSIKTCFIAGTQVIQYKEDIDELIRVQQELIESTEEETRINPYIIATLAGILFCTIYLQTSTKESKSKKNGSIESCYS